MADLGYICLLIALALAIYSPVASMAGVRLGSRQLTLSAHRAILLAPLVLAVSTAGLVGAFVNADFSVSYVAEHSSRAMAPQYIWVAFYAGNEGSLLFIAFALSVLAAIAVHFAPASLRPSMPHVGAVLMLVQLFFLAVMVFLANPFARLDFVPPDGRGINPLLTHPGMFVHPPMLMTGLISFAVPFSIAMGSLLAGRTADEWVDAGRTWGIISWALLGIGLLLGGWWAYTILGWGGYWAWDPVENAGFMPWLVITAFIHSIMVQKRRGMFRMWNLALVIIAFGFAQFGMFINRGGPVPSVHSFGQSTLGWIFLAFMGGTMLVAFAVFFWRYNSLKSAQTLESALSREAAFLVNNLLFLGVAFVTLWGVVYPLVSELFQGEIVTVGGAVLQPGQRPAVPPAHTAHGCGALPSLEARELGQPEASPAGTRGGRGSRRRTPVGDRRVRSLGAHLVRPVRVRGCGHPARVDQGRARKAPARRELPCRLWQADCRQPPPVRRIRRAPGRRAAGAGRDRIILLRNPA